MFAGACLLEAGLKQAGARRHEWAHTPACVDQ
jgi:hypothetical protein